MTEKQTGDLIAVMANTVAEARHSLTVPEQRLILWLVAQIEREDDALKEYTLSILEFDEILGTNNGRLYSQMEEACNQLQSRVLELRTGPSERTKFNWMHRVRYLDKEGRVILRFHDDLKPVLLQLRERFCKIPLRSILKLRSGYAIRWLEMLYSRKHLGSFYMSVKELRDWLHIEEGELERVVHLNQRAIDYPRKELELKSHLTFTSKPKKVGRKITGWVFTIRENKPKEVQVKAKKTKAKVVPVPTVPADDPAKRAEWAADLAALKQSLGRPPVTSPAA